jgi:CRISPR/Cas system-associated protein Cas10 (large subunit of type III CRISPR-Cas system)
MRHADDSIRLLDRAKDRIVLKSDMSAGDGRPLLTSQWDTLIEIAEEISEACRGRDLGAVARKTRKMKNKLRRPQFRRRLEALESDDMESSEKCQCSKCNAPIELKGGQKCVSGTLCPKCALSQKNNDNDDDDDMKSKTQKKQIGESALRRRRY